MMKYTIKFTDGFNKQFSISYFLKHKLANIFDANYENSYSIKKSFKVLSNLRLEMQGTCLEVFFFVNLFIFLMSTSIF